MAELVIPLTSCAVCYGYRLKLARVAGDLHREVLAEYRSHRASHG